MSSSVQQPVPQPVLQPLPQPEVTVTVCPDGPLLVRGPVEVRGPDGVPVERRRRTVALCRCGLSGIKPWCDGSHKLART